MRAAWTGQSLVFWVFCFLWKCIKKTGHTIPQASWTGCFLGPEAFKSWCEGRQVELIFFTSARREAQIFFVLVGKKGARERRGQLPEPEMKSEELWGSLVYVWGLPIKRSDRSPSWLCLVKSLLLRLPFFILKFVLRLQSNKSRHSLVGHMWGGGGCGGDEGEVWVEVCPQGLQFLTLGLIKTKIVQFATLFETRRLNFLTLIHFVSRTELSNSKTVITSWNKVFGKKKTN